MRTVRFSFDMPCGPQAGLCLETIREAIRGPGEPLAVALSPVHVPVHGTNDVGPEGSGVLLDSPSGEPAGARPLAGVEVSGEYELVAMACERIRRYLWASGVSFHEDDWTTDSCVTPRSMLDRGEGNKTDSRRSESGRERPILPMEASSGMYPNPSSTRRGEGGRRHWPREVKQEEALRQARSKLEYDDLFGFAIPSALLSVDEWQALSFHRALESGLAFVRLGLHEDALRCLKEAVRLRPGSSEAHHHLGLLYDHLGRYDLAERHLRKAIDAGPGMGASHFYLGNLHQRQGRYTQAIAEYKRCIEQDPEVAIVFNNLGWVLYQMGDFERAIRAFEETIALDADLPFPHNGLACVYQTRGNLADAIAEFRRAIELYPEYAAAHLKLGWCLLQAHDFSAAIAAFRAVLLHSDDAAYNSSAYYSLGHTYVAQDEMDNAREAFRQVLEINSGEFVDALLHLGIVEFRQGAQVEAMKLFRRYVRRAGAEASHEVYKYIAHICLDEGRVVAAANACRNALLKSPDDAEVYDLMGQIAGHRGDWLTAEVHLRHAIELSGHDASCWYHLGWVLESQGQVQGAIDAYKAAILHDPQASHAYNNLGWLYLEQGKREEALVIFERALEVNASDTVLLNNLGWLYADQRRYQEALAYYQRALLIEPDSGMLHCNAGTLYQQMGWDSDARRELETAVKLADDHQAVANAHYYLALLDKTQGRTRSAIEHLRKSLDVEPSLSAAWFRIAECWALEGNSGECGMAATTYLAQDPHGEFEALARALLAEHSPPASATVPSSPGGGTPCRTQVDGVPRRRKRPREASSAEAERRSQ